MLERIDTWIILALLFGTMACGLAAALMYIRNLRTELQNEKDWSWQLRVMLDESNREKQTILDRDEAGRCHAVMIREAEIEKLRDELAASKKYSGILESAMNRMWPGGERNGSQ